MPVPAERLRLVSPIFTEISCKIRGMGVGSFFLQAEKSTNEISINKKEELCACLIITMIIKIKKVPGSRRLFTKTIIGY